MNDAATTAASPAPGVQDTAAASSGPPASRASLWPAASTLWRRELVRFFRQKNRVVSALITPVILWAMLGAGLNSAFSLPAGDGGDASGGGGVSLGYAYFFTGAVTMILLFTAIFSTISVIEDRREGFLQGVLVSPAPRLAIALGKVLGGASIATVHGVVFLLLWPIVGEWASVGSLLTSMALGVVAMFVVALGLTGLGMCIAWPMDSTAGFHAIMMVFLMPMWFLSGAVFPLHTAPIWLQAVMWVNPLTYGHLVLSGVLNGAMTGTLFYVSLGVTLAFTAAILLLATRLIGKPRKDGLA